MKMARSKSFKALVQSHERKDKKFAEALLREGVDAMLSGDVDTIVGKTVALVEPIKKSFEPYAGAITSAFVYGSVAKGSDTATSDIDLMVIGDDLNYSDLYTAAQAVEATLRRKVNPLFVSRKDWCRKISKKGSVFEKINHSPKIFVIGSEKDLESGPARAR
jgi:predicted nucleotidyltransferase